MSDTGCDMADEKTYWLDLVDLARGGLPADEPGPGESIIVKLVEWLLHLSQWTPKNRASGRGMDAGSLFWGAGSGKSETRKEGTLT